MLLNEYQWSLNPRGLHNPMVYRGPQMDRCRRLQLGWYKMTAAGTEFLSDCQTLLSNNITPVIRIYRHSPGAEPVDDWLRAVWAQYVRAGAKWIEFYNEPNLAFEWPSGGGLDINFRNRNGVIRPLMENWLVFAEYIINIGGYPGFPALAEAASYAEASVPWMDAMLSYLREFHYDRFRTIINNGLWFSAHPATLNHFYQETPGQPLIPRPPEAMNANEPGWHFEYPYDPISQIYDPGRTVFGGTALTPYGDPSGIIAMGTVIMQRLAEWFNAGVVPLVGTEGGCYPSPLEGPIQLDKRYPVVTAHSHGEGTVAMYNWIATVAPPWHFGISSWKEDEYYDANLPALVRLEQTPQVRRAIPPLRSDAPGEWNGYVGRGPGPVHGEPSFHVVVLAPGLDPQWFFESARAYWNTFRPMVTTTWDFINYIPYDRSLAATVIAPPDMVESMTQIISQQWPNVFFDLLVASGSYDAVAEQLNARVWGNRRFG